ncbi:MAG: ATP-dependent helicase HrpB [Pseudomonadota bacterium]
MTSLPIDAVLPELLDHLVHGSSAVLAAPPGAGKTTRVPLALMNAPWARGKILMLEPRRLAARAAAERMAATLDQRVGAEIGYRVRGDARPGRRVEVVTEGILTRMLQNDPDLPGIAAVLFDEIHERSIHSDLGLALALEAQAALRPDLRLVAMSATLDTARLSALLGGCPVVESAGRAHPVETRWLERPWKSGTQRRGAFAQAVSDLVSRALAEAEGDILAFLPGVGEISRVAALLQPHYPDIAIQQLYGAQSFAEQQAALRAQDRRRVVLSTALAETSLTVEGVRVVVDGGQSRKARVNPATGMSRLVTGPVSRAEADQRRGRAGRVAPGVCYRLWTRGEEGALPAFAEPEILTTDLAPLALELALWGVEDAASLAFLDPPPGPAMAEARRLLTGLGALDRAGRITPHGREMAAHPLHPRLAHMLTASADRASAALVAALLAEGDPIQGGNSADLGLRISAMAGRKPSPALNPAKAARIRQEAKRLHKGAASVTAGTSAVEAAGLALLHAYPDRVALRRVGEAPRYLLANGRGAVLRPGDPLSGQRLLVAAELEDSGREATIRLAAPLAETDLRHAFPGQIAWVETAEWSRRTRQVEARRREMFGEIALADQIWRDAPPGALGAALAEGIRERGLDALDWSKGALALRRRIGWLAASGMAGMAGLPDWSDTGLLTTLDDWLTPHLAGMRRIEDTARLDLAALLLATLDWPQREAIDAAAPAHFTTALGSRIAIDYGGEAPAIRVRVQEMFGVTEHPRAAGQPLTIELLSPAGRPVQTTRDLPGFWTGSYADVAKDMRARYPKHPWPEDPARQAPTRRAKPRAT